jgi:GR25 family glycosyltransferase involved in LPS biosynthesis
MEKISMMYYINLDRRPNRNEHFFNQCIYANIPFSKIKRYQAIDGSTYQFTEEQKAMFKKVDYKNHSYEKNIMGNQLSHYNILLEMIEKEYEYILICQDDVIFRKDFNKELNIVMADVPVDAEIINIGFHKFAAYNQFIPWDLNQRTEDAVMTKKVINKGICILTETTNPCSLAYIVTLKGAKNMVQHFNKIGFLRATDWNYNDYLRNKNIFYGSRIVLCTGDNTLGSDIFV